MYLVKIHLTSIKKCLSQRMHFCTLQNDDRILNSQIFQLIFVQQNNILSQKGRTENAAVKDVSHDKQVKL